MSNNRSSGHMSDMNWRMLFLNQIVVMLLAPVICSTAASNISNASPLSSMDAFNNNLVGHPG